MNVSCVFSIVVTFMVHPSQLAILAVEKFVLSLDLLILYHLDQFQELTNAKPLPQRFHFFQKI